ncbi:hypothetical protein ACLOJK_004923 [Asimina triloba]
MDDNAPEPFVASALVREATDVDCCSLWSREYFQPPQKALRSSYRSRLSTLESGPESGQRTPLYFQTIQLFVSRTSMKKANAHDMHQPIQRSNPFIYRT